MKQLTQKQCQQLNAVLESLPKETTEPVAVTHILNQLENCEILKPGVADRILNANKAARVTHPAGADPSGFSQKLP